MRCEACNVDLGEKYTRCPLCGSVSVNKEPLISGFKTAEYPLVFKKVKKIKKVHRKIVFSSEKMKAFLSI